MIARTLLMLLLATLAACGASPTPTPSPLPDLVPTLLPRAVDHASDFCPPPPNWYVYLAEAGDTLQSLAERSSSSVSELATANCLQNPRVLTAGQVIYLPKQPITP